ncbi:hypothetical protein FNF29_00113 [Cafeteria roenbergensis]|uniref:Uncharacterized protein n=1 Tax=Cafeteria roenbergensis TaxID=33653 RepID=A0A5A8CYU5_CAFRO|nr:hypothetical protein FNF29_00113 [Cafeteria roenbergensis]|eukprot:KAA0157537.1 hypothetical protein FNF29_00113 [Cafeteria roenbergensis]
MDSINQYRAFVRGADAAGRSLAAATRERMAVGLAGPLARAELDSASSGQVKTIAAFVCAFAAGGVQLPALQRLAEKRFGAYPVGTVTVAVALGLVTVSARLAFESQHAEAAVALGLAAKRDRRVAALAPALQSGSPHVGVHAILDSAVQEESRIMAMVLKVATPRPDAVASASAQAAGADPQQAPRDADQEELLRVLVPDRPSVGGTSAQPAGGDVSDSLGGPLELGQSGDEELERATELAVPSLIGLRALRKVWWRTAKSVLTFESVGEDAIAAAESALRSEQRR